MNPISTVSQNIQLKGILEFPKKANTIALLVNGSGKIDCDGNLGKLKLNTSKALADYLSLHDIASLRFDKRGVGKSQGDFLQTTFEDNLDDVNAWLDYLKNHYPDKKRIIIGHSEGAIIATRIAASRTDIDGIVLLAGCASNCREILHWQIKQVMGSLQGLQKWIIKLLPFNPEKMQQNFLNRVEKSQGNVIRIMKIKKFNAGWLRQMLAYNPGDDFANILCPILAITGEKDLQMPAADLEKMKQLAQAPIECHALKDLTHLLRKDPQPASVSRYKALIKQPLDEEMLSIIQRWVSAR